MPDAESCGSTCCFTGGEEWFQGKSKGRCWDTRRNIIYFILSALGLGALLMSSATLFQIIRWTGAAYLVFVGVRMLITKERFDIVSQDAPSTVPSMPLFSHCLVTQLSNPKAIIFFSALLPQFVSPEQSVTEQFTILGVISIAMSFWYWRATAGPRSEAASDF
ncbi:MAG TPA: LysE family translocator [Blastocatellia bacterium]|nr:LysE family translocator [Blastocatellia bacterium]